ncbi:MAG: hypothetical protein IT177_11105 [Acidobacteria bacterium]|nr:hypothetical protein [Acidobacteriota bacterium]
MAKTDGSGGEQYLLIDVGRPANGKLAKLAGRIRTRLPRHPGTKQNQDLAATLDLFLGGVHALFLASEGGFKERRRQPIELKVVHKRAEDLSSGKLRQDGLWSAGFHFNSGITRLSAVYHRILKIVAPPLTDDDAIGVLLPRVSRMYCDLTGSPWRHSAMGAIHAEVNRLKHSEGGLGKERKVGLPLAVQAADELLTLLEAWDVHGRPRG